LQHAANMFDRAIHNEYDFTKHPPDLQSIRQSVKLSVIA